MKGFLQRDLSLLEPWSLLYPLLLLATLVAARASPWSGVNGSMTSIALILWVQIVHSLMRYDEMGTWCAYAAAVPKGRKHMVDARYFLVLCGTLVLAVVLSLQSLLRGDFLQPLWSAVFEIDALLFILSVTLPISYHWGMMGKKGLLAFTISALVMLGLLAGIVSMVLYGVPGGVPVGALWAEAEAYFAALTRVFTLLALGIFALSWRISRHIMEKKEF